MKDIMKNKKRPKIGLALGSGGARGLSLIGIIKILEKNQIPIDLIAGTSIGAMIGGFYASGISVPDMEKIALETNWKLILSLIDPKLKEGLIGGDKVRGYIQKYLSQTKIEDCRIPFTAVATDFETGEPVAISKGDLTSAIRASISIPIVFKPVRLEGRMLVDGGLCEPIPVGTAKRMGADIVIAVNLDNREATAPSLGLYNMADNSLGIMKHHLALKDVQMADVTITPKVYGIRWDKFLNGQDLIAAGEKAAKKAMPDIKNIITEKSKSGFEKFLESAFK